MKKWENLSYMPPTRTFAKNSKKITLTQADLDLMLNALQGSFCYVPLIEIDRNDFRYPSLLEIENDDAIRLVGFVSNVEARLEVLKKSLRHVTQQINKYQDFLPKYKKISERLYENK